MLRQFLLRALLLAGIGVNIAFLLINLSPDRPHLNARRRVKVLIKASHQREEREEAADRIKLELQRRGLSRFDPEVRLEALKLTGYEERIGDFDLESKRVFFRVQELEAREDVKRRESFEPHLAGQRYELGGKLITLALILLSVTILANRPLLFWGGVLLGSIGLLVAFDGYFLFI